MYNIAEWMLVIGANMLAALFIIFVILVMVEVNRYLFHWL